MKCNMMKARDTLERIDMLLVSINCIDAVQKQSIDKCRMLIKQSLSAPPRNCDVGTAEEQAERYHATGEVYHTLTLTNALEWSQMPYEAQEGGAK